MSRAGCGGVADERLQGAMNEPPHHLRQPRGSDSPGRWRRRLCASQHAGDIANRSPRAPARPPRVRCSAHAAHLTTLGDPRPAVRLERSAVTAPVPAHSSAAHSPPPWPRAVPAPGTRGAPAPGPRSPCAHPRPQRPGRPPAGHRAAALRLGRGASRGPPPGPVRGQRSRGGRTRSPTAAPRLGLHACPPPRPGYF